MRVYSIWPRDKTSRTILHRALALQFLSIKFLKSGLAGWKAKASGVEPYREVVHL
jgi:hypothetical protein